MANGFHLDASGLLKGLTNMETRSDLALKMYAETSALKLQNYARENRPWTDRTGHARQRLTCNTEVIAKGYKLILAHGVDYGIWLELAHEKNYAIIQPTILEMSPKVLEGLSKLLERLK